MIKAFTKTNTRAVAEEIEAALAGIAAKHGITIRYNGGSILGDTAVVLKLRLESLDPDAQRNEFAKDAPFFGLDVADYGKVLNVNGRAMRLVGIDLKRRKFPLKMEVLADKTFVGLTEAMVPRIKAASATQ